MSELAKALTAFHADLPEVGKGSVNPAFHSKYADLADIVKVVLPALAKQGLAWITTPTVTDEGFVLAYELRHTSGDSVSGSWPLPDPAKATAQQLGSAVTYAKRYTLSAVTGIAPDEDDDGNAASQAKGSSRRQAPQRGQAERVKNALTALGEATDLAGLEKVWRRVEDGGLSGVSELKDYYSDRKGDLAGTQEPERVDEWAVAPVPQ